MASRAPTSLLLLIDRRNRLEGELQKLKHLKQEAANLHRHVAANLAAIDAALAEHPIQLDVDILTPQKTYKSNARDRYGWLTHSILRALKGAQTRSLTATQIRAWIDDHWPDWRPRPTNHSEWARTVRRRLQNLRSAGVVLSPVVGNGRTSQSTWMINPDRWASESLGNTPTPLDVDCPGNTRKKMEMGHSVEHG